ncbi:MAG: 3-hydroxyacyl-CoA dehydrogenase/enoyl-CoA hydratase family protein [Candidatus Neomarinimicrobiota bacterium]
MSEISSVGVIGAGTMGSGISQKLAQEGFHVVMIDMKERFIQRGLNNIGSVLEEGVKRGLFTSHQVEEIMGRIDHSTDLDAVRECHLVIEAVYEDLDAKSQLFSLLGTLIGKDTIVATNTSSFSISQLAESTSFPGRFIGLHFFYHATKNRLVEVIRGAKTSNETYRTVMRFVKRIGKDPIVCRDSFGFAVNRFFVPWLNEAVRLSEEGVASPEEIDSVCCLAFQIPMGPFTLMNATGIVVAYHAQKTLENGFGSFYRPADALKKQAESDRKWILTEHSPEVEKSKSRVIIDRMLGVVFTTCGQILHERVTTPGELNRGARIGLRWKKGPIDLMEDEGEQRVRELVARISEKWGVRPPASLTRNAWTMEFVTLSNLNGSAVLTLTRPEELNALNGELLNQLQERYEAAKTNDDVSTIFITGEGKAFMAGADIKFFIQCLEKNDLDEIRSFTELASKVFTMIDQSPKTVVAVVNGLALGGGLELALTADVILGTEKAVVAFPETGLGIYPGLGGTVRTPRRIGRELSKYLIYTGVFLSAKEAEEIGLVDAVVNFDDADEMMSGQRLLPHKRRVTLPKRWQAIADYFSANNLESILTGKAVVPEGLSPEEAKETERVIQMKAPVALKMAEGLLDESGGIDGELKNLNAVFSTEDALLGLKSVGRKPPRFHGR